jgi:hypothetical protein
MPPNAILELIFNDDFGVNHRNWKKENDTECMCTTTVHTVNPWMFAANPYYVVYNVLYDRLSYYILCEP